MGIKVLIPFPTRLRLCVCTATSLTALVKGLSGLFDALRGKLHTLLGSKASPTSVSAGCSSHIIRAIMFAVVLRDSF